MRARSKVHPEHLSRQAYIYIRQSSPGQVVKNPESGRRQRELVKLAGVLGWPPSRIEVLDADQGRSGQSATGREAFKRLTGEVSVGAVGIVVGLEVSRLARNGADWFPLLEMCALTGTLIADEEGVYDPREPNDRLVLGLKGTISEAELHVLRTRLHGARWSLARRGELRRKIPAGYAWDEQGRVVLDPDERVRSALDALFRCFDAVGSARGVARVWAREGLLFPRRDFRGRWDGPLHWAALSVRTVNRILHNPFYAGAYFYGERRAETRLDPETRSRRTVLRHLPLESWEVLLQGAHPAYVSWEQFLRNQERLRENWSMSKGGSGAARTGTALLQGIAFCGRCGRQMRVRYSGRIASPMYVCTWQTATGESVYCLSVSGQPVDRWVEEQILEAIQPLGLEAALEAVEELERRSAEIRRQWELRLEQAEYEAGLARRRYEAVDPDHRLVAGTLERDWDERLQEVERLRQELAERSRQPPLRILPEDRERLEALARDLPRLWHAETTQPEDRKKAVRILVRDVWLTPQDEPRLTKLELHWQTGVVTHGQVERPLPIAARFRTPEPIVARIRELTAGHLSAAEIAETLNREGLKTGRGNPFNKRRVQTLLRNPRVATQEPESAAAALPTLQPSITQETT